MSTDDFLPNKRTYPQYMWAYVTICPSCGEHTIAGSWSRADVIYEDCMHCGYKGEMTVHIREWRQDDEQGHGAWLGDWIRREPSEKGGTAG